jgi:hypothetical protein
VLLTISERRIFLWNANDGGLLWDSLLKSNATTTASFRLFSPLDMMILPRDYRPNETESFDIILLTQNAINVLNGNDGSLLSAFNL